jgi:serine/threonine-protein kinase
MSFPEARSAKEPTFGPDELLQDTYRILQPLATGGMGEVYLARHERLQSDVAVKVLSRALVDDQAARARFVREAGILSVLRHPHIVQVFDFNITGEGIPYLVMELLEGPTLGEYLARNGPLPPDQVARIVKQMASALEAAHGRGIVHRDLKPDNVILLQPEGDLEFAKVFDFGICRTIGSPRLTTDSSVLGTPEYMAPEQARGDELDVRTDEFALAAMTFTLLTGQQPFRGDKPVSVLYQIVHEEPPSISQFVSWPSAGVEAVLMRGLAKDPEDRFPHVLEFAQALEAAVAALAAAALPSPDILAATAPHLASAYGTTPSPAGARPGSDLGASARRRTARGAERRTVRARPRRPFGRWVLPGLAFLGSAVATYSLGPERTRAAGETLTLQVRKATRRTVNWLKRGFGPSDPNSDPQAEVPPPAATTRAPR